MADTTEESSESLNTTEENTTIASTEETTSQKSTENETVSTEESSEKINSTAEDTTVTTENETVSTEESSEDSITTEETTSQSSSEDKGIVYGNIVVGKYIHPPKNESESLIQLLYQKTWKLNDKTALSDIDTTKTLTSFFATDGKYPISQLVTDLSEDEIKSINVISSPGISTLSSNINDKNVLDPTLGIITTTYDSATINDLKYTVADSSTVSTEATDGNTIVLVYPEELYDKLFDSIDNVDITLTDDDYYGLNTEQVTFKYRIIEFVNENDVNNVKILSTKESSTALYTKDFKVNDTDSVTVYKQDDVAVQSTKTELQNTIAQLEIDQESYTTTKSDLESQLKTVLSDIDSKSAEIQTFEDNHKTTPEDGTESDAYFDASKLDSDDKEEYDTLNKELEDLNTKKDSINTQISENETANKEEDIATQKSVLTEFERLISSYSTGDSLLSKYFVIDSTITGDDIAIPIGDYILVTETVKDDTERDFSDTEANNAPYYYLVGKFEDHDINGTTQRCIVFTSVNRYDTLKTCTALKTYHKFDSIYYSSNVLKKYINSLRSQTDNAIPEESISVLIDNNTTFYPTSEISEVYIADNSNIIPSLSILIESSTTDDDSGSGSGTTDDDKKEDTTEDDSYSQYLHSGTISVINDNLFIVPENSDIVKKIVYVNGYYYILMTNCYIYKLDEDFNLITTIDLSKLSTDISKTNIFSIGTMLIIQSDKTYVTDLESVKNNYGISDTDVTIDSVKVNTKTIVKIMLKK